MKGQKRTRSATVPETIEAAVATKTTWKKKSESRLWPSAEVPERAKPEPRTALPSPYIRL